MRTILYSAKMTARDKSLVLCLVLVLSDTINGQRGDKWSWSNNRNNIEEQRDQNFNNRRKFENLEDFRSERYEVNEASTRKPFNQRDEFVNDNGAHGYNQGLPAPATNGLGYNSNSFGAFPPNGLGGGYPSYANGGPGFSSNNYRPGFNGPFNGPYGNGAFGNGAGYYPGGGYGPNRFNGYNPLGNNPANGILVGPGGPTGIYGRPNHYQPNFGGLYNNPNGYYTGYGPNGFGPNNGFAGPVGPGINGYGPFNSKSGGGILADENNDEQRNDKESKTNE